MRCTPLRDAAGGLTGAIGVALDVTERIRAEEARRKSEEQFRRLVETANEGIWVIDRDARVTFVNRRMAEMLQWSPEEMSGRSVYDFMDARWREVARAQIEDPKFRAGEGGQVDFMYRRRDGSELWVIVSRTPILDADGNYVGALATVTDVTERRGLEFEILEAGEAERRRIGQDLHDSLGQNLAALTLLSRMLADRLNVELPEEAPEATKIAVVAQDAARQARLLARRLWTPVKAGPQALREALEALAQETGDLFSVDCRFSWDDEALPGDQTVATQVYLITREAVNNAVRHGHARRIDVSLKRQDAEAVLEIRDDGTGIAEGAAEGKGIGLRSMRYRAAVMGASLTIGPAPGGGTIVTCRMPVSAVR